MLKIYGRSDDLVCANIDMETKCSKCGKELEDAVDGVVSKYQEEFPAYDLVIRFLIGLHEKAVVVEMKYEDVGVWSAKIIQVGRDISDNGYPILWPISVTSHDESVMVRIECPEGTPVKVGRSNV